MQTSHSRATPAQLLPITPDSNPKHRDPRNSFKQLIWATCEFGKTRCWWKYFQVVCGSLDAVGTKRDEVGDFDPDRTLQNDCFPTTLIRFRRCVEESGTLPWRSELLTSCAANRNNRLLFHLAWRSVSGGPRRDRMPGAETGRVFSRHRCTLTRRHLTVTIKPN